MDYNPAIGPVFDTGFGVGVPPEIIQPLDIARQITSGLAGQITEHVTNTMAQAAASTVHLQDAIHNDIRQRLMTSADNVQALQQPILTQVTGEIGSVAEAASRLGAVPSIPGQPGIMPPAVVVREAALQGDLSPALEWFRDSALPFATVGGKQYGNAVQRIVLALPDDANLRDDFYRAIDNIRRDVSLQAIQTATVAPVQQGAMQTPAAGGAGIQAVTPQVAPDATQQAGTTVTPFDAIGDQVKCEAEAAAALANALYQCAIQFRGDEYAIANCQTEVQRRFLLNPPCGERSPGAPPPGGVGIVPTPNGPRPVIRQGPGGTCPPGTHPGLAWNGVDMQSCIPDRQGGAVPGGPAPGGPGEPAPGGGGGAGGAAPPPPSAPPMPPGGTTPPCVPQGCKDKAGNPQTVGSVGAAVTADYATTGDIFASAARISEQLGIPITVEKWEEACPVGFTDYGVNTGDQYSHAVKLCINCPTTDCPPPPSANQCCPVTVNVNCPTAPTAPPKSTGGGPPGETAPAPAPPAPPQVGQQNPAGCDEFPPVPVLQNINIAKGAAVAAGLRNADGSVNLPYPDAGITDPIGVFANTVVSYLARAIDQGGSIIEQLVKGSGCASGEQMALAATQVVVGLFNNYVANVFANVETPIRQQRNFLCPVDLPSPGEAATAFLANTISEKTLECWVRAAGTRYPEFKTVVDAARQKFPVMQLGSLYLRGELTKQQLADRIREAGMTQGTDVEDLIKLLQVIPPPSDLVRFMVRDVDDKDILDTFNLDHDFEKKFVGKLPDWAESSGVSEDYMRRVWRAHWQIPSPTQLFEMLHRSAELQPGDDRFTTIEEVQTALEQQDILPYWIPAILNMSYNVIGRIDLRRGYQYGVLSFDQLVTKYMVAGYNEADANTLATITDRQITESLIRSPVVTQMANGELTDEGFSDLLKFSGATDEQVATARRRAMVLCAEHTRKRCSDAYHKRFVIGDLSAADARANLAGQGVPADIAELIVSGWQCERDAGGKAIPAGELAKLYDMGAIDASGLAKRLQAIGYSYDDAVLLTRRIATTTQQKLDKADADRLRRSEQEEIRAEKQAASDARRAAAQGQKQQNRLNALARVATQRTKRLQESGRNFSTHSGASLPAAVSIVTALYQRQLSSTLYLPEEIIAAIVTASKDKSVTDADKLYASVTGLLASALIPSPG